MTYFKYFSKYISTTIDKKMVVVTDIFKRVGLGDQYKDIASLLIPYLVSDGETPELVSNKFYNTPEYHWVILLINGITNPRTEWPISNDAVEKLVYEKYTFNVIVADPGQYSVGDIISRNTDTFVVTDVDIATQIVKLRSQSGIVDLVANETVINETTEVSGLILAGIVSRPPTEIHHYYDTTSQEIIDINAIVEEDGAFVNVYTLPAANLVPITNIEFELSLNDDKRTVSVLDSKYLGQFVRDFKNILG